MDLNKHEHIIKEVVDSFIKMCNYIEQTPKNGCVKCPIQKECYANKHDGLVQLMEELNVKRDENEI